MKTLKVLSLLLCYPDAEWHAELNSMAGVLAGEALFSEPRGLALQKLIDEFRHQDVLDLQENYVALFDRGRYLSLHLFEHVHGESRDRGQAMVDLLQHYEAQGFAIAARELPDYLPLFLEFLSMQTAETARQWLQDAGPVLSLLSARLAKRQSAYRAVFEALSELAGTSDSNPEILEGVAAEGPDDTLANMDAIWEEEAVSFMAAAQPCAPAAPTSQPIRITSRDEYRRALNQAV